MALFKHKGGSLRVTNPDGTTGILHYGEGLHTTCPECKQPPHELCITKSGNLLGKIHKARG